jgi:phenylalanyl-tRNA synthetase beta chain
VLIPLAVEELEDLCFDFGIEYDGDVGYLESRPGVKLIEQNSKDIENAKAKNLPLPAQQIKIEIPANRYVRFDSSKLKLINRYDLLCIEGLARALRVFLQKEQPPTYALSNPAQMQEVFVEASVRFPFGNMKELIPRLHHYDHTLLLRSYVLLDH